MSNTVRCEKVDLHGMECGTVTFSKDKVSFLERGYVRSAENIDYTHLEYTDIVFGCSHITVKGSLTYWEQIIFS